MRVGILTSGGDAPGMNACVRAVVRGCIYYGMEVIGIHQGYEGLLNDDMEMMQTSSVADIIHRGGTILQTARCARFENDEGILPDAPGRSWFECDIDYDGKNRGVKRIVYSSDGLIYYTEDHYNTFEDITEPETRAGP